MEAIVKSLNEGYRIGKIPTPNAIAPLLGFIGRAYADSGQTTPSPDELKRTTSAVEEDTRKHFPAISLEELNHVIQKMIRGYYFEFTGITVANIHKALKVYMKSQERADFIKMARNANQKQLPQNAELSEHEKREKMIAYTAKAFNQLKEHGHFEDLGNAIYDFLDTSGVLKISKEKKWEIHDEAIKQVKREKQAEKEAATDPFRKLDISKYLKALEKAQGGTEITRMAKKIALNNFFSGLIEMDMDVREFIEEKING